jgi:hypothetical protein
MNSYASPYAVDPLAKALDLVSPIGDCQRTGLLEIAVDPVGARELDQSRKVLEALLLEDRDLVGKVANAVGKAVGQARIAKPPVPTAGAVPDRVRLQDDHP